MPTYDKRAIRQHLNSALRSADQMAAAELGLQERREEQAAIHDSIKDMLLEAGAVDGVWWTSAAGIDANHDYALLHCEDGVIRVGRVITIAELERRLAERSRPLVADAVSASPEEDEDDDGVEFPNIEHIIAGREPLILDGKRVVPPMPRIRRDIKEAHEALRKAAKDAESRDRNDLPARAATIHYSPRPASVLADPKTIHIPIRSEDQGNEDALMNHIVNGEVS